MDRPGCLGTLALTVALALAACDNPPPTTAPPPAPPPGATPTATADTSARRTDAAPLHEPNGATTRAAGLDAGAPGVRDAGGRPAGPTDAGTQPADASSPHATDGALDAGRATHTVDAGGGADAGAAGDLAAATVIFNRACGRCHPHGDGDTGPALRRLRWGEARLRAKVRAGGDGMPPFRPSRLSDPDLTTMMLFLRSIQAVR